MIGVDKLKGELNALLNAAYYEVKARRDNRVPLPPRQAISVEIFLNQRDFVHELRKEAAYEETKTALWTVMNHGNRMNQYLAPRTKKLPYQVWVRIVVRVDMLPIFTPADLKYLYVEGFGQPRQTPTANRQRKDPR